MKKVLAVCGATASGKTALAVACAKAFDGEIISADALLVYKRLNIGTAKPTEEEKQGVPHYMIDVVQPTESFSVGDYEKMALPIVEDILARGKTPILCGGTGFYMNALLFERSMGCAPASQEIREKYARLELEKGKEYLHDLLKEVDGESAKLLHPNDVKRVVRALEIYELTGRKKSEQKDGDTPRFPFVSVCFSWERERLYERINARVEQMFRLGLVDEVKGLLQSGVPEDAQCMQGIGYKEVVEGLKNGSLQSTMSDIIKQNTRNYAKRQLTFFKKMQNLREITPCDLDRAVEEVRSFYDD